VHVCERHVREHVCESVYARVCMCVNTCLCTCVCVRGWCSESGYECVCVCARAHLGVFLVESGGERDSGRERDK